MSDENVISTMITCNLGELFAALAEVRKEFGTCRVNQGHCCPTTGRAGDDGRLVLTRSRTQHE